LHGMLVRPLLFAVVLASLAAVVAADVGDDIVAEMQAERSQVQVNSDGTFEDADADSGASDAENSRSEETFTNDEQGDDSDNQIRLNIPKGIKDHKVYYYSGLSMSFYNILKIFKRIQCNVGYDAPIAQVELESEDWIGYFGVGLKYIPRTVRYTFPRDTTTAKFELPPFWNTAVNFTGCKRIKCTETTFSDEDNKVEAESLAILAIALTIVVFCRKLSHFGLLHYLMAGASSVVLIGLIVGIFFWNRLSGEAAIFGGLGASATGMGYVFGGEKVKDNVEDVWNQIKIFVLYAAVVFFVFSIWLFHGFKTNQLACCGDTRSKLFWISSLMENALYIAGCAIIYSYTTGSAILGVVLVGMALVTSFVINQMDLFDEHIEVQDKRQYHNLEAQSSCCCCRSANRELTAEAEVAAHTRDAVHELMLSPEGIEWAKNNRQRFEKNPPPENMTDYQAWVSTQIGGDEVHVMRRQDESRCVIS